MNSVYICVTNTVQVLHCQNSVQVKRGIIEDEYQTCYATIQCYFMETYQYAAELPKYLYKRDAEELQKFSESI